MRQIAVILLILLCSIASKAQSKKSSEDQAIIKTYISFQKFYLKNANKFNQFKLHKGTTKNDGPPFIIQWKEAERYFAYLRKNVPQVGKAYIENERKDFLQSEKYFKEDPREEIASGFDYDRWAGGQEEPSYMVKENINPKNKYEVIYKGNKAALIITAPNNDTQGYSQAEIDELKRMVIFTKEKGKWLISENITYYDADYIAGLAAQ